MDWKDIGKQIVSLGAPLLGTALGGPAGGAVGALVANAFGAEKTPEAISAAFKQDPQAALKLQDLQLKHEDHLAELTLKKAQIDSEERLGTIKEINATMRTEATSEHWPQWGWRPYWGFISGTAFLCVCVFVCALGYQAIKTKDMNAITMIPLMVGAFTTLFGIPGAILGISAWGRNKQKEKQADPASAVKELVGKIM